jgi:hypothetical protein
MRKMKINNLKAREHHKTKHLKLGAFSYNHTFSF